MLKNDLKIGDEIFFLKVLKKIDDRVPRVHFHISGAIKQPAFGKHVIEGNSGGHFMKLNFADAPQHVLFDRDDPGSVVEIGNV